MLNLIIADSEIETIPRKIANEPPIKEEAEIENKDATDLLLNSNYHHDSMGKLKENERRGRPDIVHICVLSALESILNKENLLKTYVHTRNDKILKIKSETRIPRSFNRFSGLMEELFQTKKVPKENPLIELEDKSLSALVEDINAEKNIAFSPNGRKIKKEEIFPKSNEEITIIVGGFPEGEFKSDVEKIADEKFSIYPDPLNAFVVINRVLQTYEENKLERGFYSKD